MQQINTLLAQELQVRLPQVEAAVQLLEQGASVPLIARCRKAASAGLDDIALRQLEQRLAYLRELEQRREAVKTGDFVRVRLLEVDLARKRIAPDMKKDLAIGAQPGANRFEASRARDAPQVVAPGAMASAFARLKA